VAILVGEAEVQFFTGVEFKALGQDLIAVAQGTVDGVCRAKDSVGLDGVGVEAVLSQVEKGNESRCDLLS